MTLQERIKASAEELGRLLREAEDSFRRIEINRGCVEVSVSIAVPLDNGKAFSPMVVEHAQGHHADQQKGDTPEAAQSHSNDVLEDGKSDHPDQQPHPGFRTTSEHVRKSENLMSKEELSLGFVELLIRESIQVIPLELVRINTPAVVLVKVPETGEENRYMMTLTPIDRSLDA